MRNVDKKILLLAKNIRLVIFDVDGVLTDGRLYLTDTGTEIKAFHSHDGLGMKLIQETGVELAIITARTSNLVTHRAQSLGIKHIYQGAFNKVVAYEDLLKKTGFTDKEIAFVGDDLTDLALLKRCMLGIAPNNARNFIKQHVNWITPSCGGKGAARDVCDLIMYAQNNLKTIHNKFLTGLLH